MVEFGQALHIVDPVGIEPNRTDELDRVGRERSTSDRSFLAATARGYVLSVEISFSRIEQANAVRDVVEHRILTVPAEVELLPDLEQDEVLDLLVFLHRLRALITKHRGE